MTDLEVLVQTVAGVLQDGMTGRGGPVVPQSWGMGGVQKIKTDQRIGSGEGKQRAHRTVDQRVVH